jgi:hypothetical protein
MVNRLGETNDFCVLATNYGGHLAAGDKSVTTLTDFGFKIDGFIN